MLTRKPVVLFDTEQGLVSAFAEAAISAFRLRGVIVERSCYDAAVQHSVSTYAPEDFQAIIWYLAKGDTPLSREIWDELCPLLESGRRAKLFTPREGMKGLLVSLVEKGIRLGLAANQPPSSLDALDAAGFGAHFSFRGLSGTLGVRKPDQRLFLAACDSLEVSPNDCVMVGDRIDLDILPARQLGMTTVLYRTGPHRGQTPRSWLEVPDAEVATIGELTQLFEHW